MDFCFPQGEGHSMRIDPTINITRMDRAIAAYKKTRPRSDNEVASFKRGYEACEWDQKMVATNMGPNYGMRP